MTDQLPASGGGHEGVLDGRPADEDALIDRVLSGDEAAFRTIYRAHAATLYRLALRLAGGRESAAEDVLQEAWARAIRRLAAFERRSSLRRWLIGIVVRCSLERIRADRRAADELPELQSVAGAASAPESRIDLERAFEALPPGYRAVLVMHDVEGYTHEEIAELMGISPGTSKSQLSRGRSWLRRALGADYRRMSHGG